MMIRAVLLAAMACSAQAFAPSALLGANSAALRAVKGPSLTAAIRPSRMGHSIIRMSADAAPLASAPAPAANFLAPPALYKAMANTGGVKAGYSWWKTLYLGILAGVYIGFGSCLTLAVGGACGGLAAAGNLGLQKIITGAFGLPFGLLMVTVGGGELFTGNTAVMTAAFSEGKCTKNDVLKNWFWSYLGNLIGAVALAVIVFHSSALSPPSVAAALTVSSTKAGLAFVPAFLRGILCNWLVCMAVWQAAAAQDIGSKALAIWFPISAFVAMGFEHSVANMFFLPLGLQMGAAGVTLKTMFLGNILPVTLGNFVAGAFFVAGSYALCFGAPGDKVKKLLG